MSRVSAPVLTDGVVLLDVFTIDDIDAQVAAEDDEHARRFGWFPERSTRATVGRTIERWRREWERHGEVRALAVRDHHDRRLLGGVELRLIGDHVAEISYWTFPAERDRGVATRSVDLLCRYAFDVLRLEHIEAHIEADNDSSLHVAAAIGFGDVGHVTERTQSGNDRIMRRLVLHRETL